jgi:fibronectin type 3 domain-containing protein/C1A family cysteine protease
MLATIMVVVVAAMFIGMILSGASITAGEHQEQIDISMGADSPPIVMSIVNDDLSISYHNPSQEDLAGLKSVWGVRDEDNTYNVLMESMGTGLAPLTSSEWNALSSSINLVDGVDSLGSVPSSVDISTEPYFPKVGNQGLQGSCAAWAITYYSYGYLEAKDNGWTGASTGNPAHLISPAWTYNRANGGTDSGSSIIRNANIIKEWGVSTLATMPYSDTDYTSWGSESAMREAPLHRSLDYFTMSFNGDSTVEDVKELLASGTPVTIAFDASMYQPGFADGNWKISSLEYASSTINHAQTIVGYDDYVSEDGEVGAFRIVNSWGNNFADSGYYWLTYNAFKEIGTRLGTGYFVDSSDYQPKLLATWEFSQSPTRNADISFDISLNGLQRDSKDLYYAINGGGSTQRFPDFLCLDITEFNDDLLAGADEFSMTVGSSTYSGQVSSFKVEKYNGYTPGYPDDISAMPGNVPAYTPCELTTSFASSGSTVPGSPRSLQASAGDSRVTLSWSAPLDDGGSSITQYRIYRGTSSYSLSLRTSVTSTSYTDSSVTNGNTYYYAVSAVNSVGEGPRSGQASARPEAQANVPGTPAGLSASPGNSQVTLSWQAPADDGGSSITGYRVYRGYSSSSLTFAASVSSTQYQITGLTNGLTYYFSVSAINSVGEGSRCTAVSATPTQSTSPPSAPLGLDADAGNRRIDLSWNAPSDNGGSGITSYKVYRGTSSSFQSYRTTVFSTSYTDTSVTNGVTYYYSVSAVNSAGEGDRSSVASATPQEPAEQTVPSAPQNLVGVPGDSTVTLSWNPPADDGGSQITGYKIYRRNEEASWYYVYSIGIQTSYTFSGLTNGHNYLFSVCAKNNLGYGPRCGEITVTPGGGTSVPSSPQNLDAVGGNGEVSLSWQTSLSDGGSPITGYRVYKGTSSSTQSFLAQVSGLGYVDNSVVNGLTYYYRITAVNSAGEGPSSSIVSVTPQAGIEKPSAPVSLSASSGDGRVTLTWNQPADDGGSPITGYRVYRGISSSNMPLFTTLSGTSLTDSTVSNGVTYYYKVTAVNGAGEGDTTGTVSATPRSSSEVTVPGKPLNLWTDVGTRSVVLHWSPPADDGGSQIMGYKIYRRTEGTSWYYVYTVGNVNQYTFSNLYGGQTYYFSVKAANEVGYGLRSNEVSATPTLSALSESSISETPGLLAMQMMLDTPSLAKLVAKTGILSADLQIDPLVGRINQ